MCYPIAQPPSLTAQASPPSLTQSASFWFGDGASQDPQLCGLSDGLSAIFGVLGAITGFMAIATWKTQSMGIQLDLLFDYAIPFFAMSAFLITCILGIRRCAQLILDPMFAHTRFGRKALVASASSVLFAFSCFYRSVNIADEGAAMCRGQPSHFNAPWAGRAVATVGEIALVVQMSHYIWENAQQLQVRGHSRLGLRNGVWNSSKRFTLLPVCLAECSSWLGILTGNPRFYCSEYVIWMCIALTWAWDSAELLHKSSKFWDTTTNAAVLMAGLGLFFFNAAFEIPHFFNFEREAPEDVMGVWECFQERDSPLWLKRLPFFFCYFFGCSWFSVMLSYRFLLKDRQNVAHAKKKA